MSGDAIEHREVVVVGGGQAGTKLDVRTVIWATGFETDHSWIGVPVFDESGRVVHQRGLTESAGLYFLGLPWQHTRGSALLGWVKDDAEHIAQQINGHRPAAPDSRSTPTPGSLT
jgi:putative flavoprotein involved in K+ transport